MSRPEYFSISEAETHFRATALPSIFPSPHGSGKTFARSSSGLDSRSRLSIPARPGGHVLRRQSELSSESIDEDRSFAVPSRMLHRSRRDEVEHFARWYSKQGYRIMDLDLEARSFSKALATCSGIPIGSRLGRIRPPLHPCRGRSVCRARWKRWDSRCASWSWSIPTSST